MGFNPCCCLTLKTGGFVIGILQIVLGSIYLVLYSCALAGFVSIKCLIDNGKFQQIVESLRDEYQGMMTTSHFEESVSLIIKLLILLVVLSVLSIVVASVLIHGIRMERLPLIKFWILCAVFDMVATLLLTVWMVQTENGPRQSLDLFVCLFGSLVDFYFICVVYHLHEEIRNGSSGVSVPVRTRRTPKV
ncbi:unnamed protein product [Orchesella dallaii]|uniref:Uncharacterized protein n=1 Tax=Orchesella dallaii TaxID=48710 RepID=A0ABP1R3P4_9HEXA